MIASAEVRIAVGERGDVSGLLLRPDGARLLYVLAHGAGAGMRHPFLEVVAQRLAGRRSATPRDQTRQDPKSTRLNSNHRYISFSRYFFIKKETPEIH